MAAFLKWLLLAPVAIVVILLAIANRHTATVVFDPFAGQVAAASLSVTLPLFIVLFAATMFGVLLGGCVVWFNQGRHRRMAKIARTDAQRARAEADRLRAQLGSLPASTTTPSGAALPALASNGRRAA